MGPKSVKNLEAALMRGKLEKKKKSKKVRTSGEKGNISHKDQEKYKAKGDHEMKKGKDYGSFKGVDLIRASESGAAKMKTAEPSKFKNFKSAISSEKIKKKLKKK